MIVDVQSTVARLNRMYLVVAKDLALEHGVDVAAKMLGMDIPEVEWLVSLDPADIEEIAEIGLPLVKLRLPERRQWNLLPRESRKGWAISRSAAA